MRSVALTLALLCCGCAALGYQQMSDGSFCESATTEFHEKSSGRSGSAWYYHESRKRSLPVPRRSMETNAEYAARVDCIRAAQAKAFQLCIDRANGIVDEETRSRQTREAYGQCGAVPLLYQL